MLGKVLWFDIRDGYGIVLDMLGNEYYTDSSVCPVDLKAGDVVTFTDWVLTGTNCAKDVERHGNASVGNSNTGFSSLP
jgi:hypothetical protein